ncbi:unnamed protein product [Phytophthora lilii]|uniref:Unnamed protein product n=1 Tax=Phytophthora lilii TaxID=2077276 RepID=A0A9W6TR93_9STRA|nr:unnamed protein product [Phytophthora lilii]
MAHNVGGTNAICMKQFLRLPGVREALAARRLEVLSSGAAPRQPKLIVIDDEPDDDLWSSDADMVKVSLDCITDCCLNSISSYYCTAANCSRNGECRDLKLMNIGDTGLGVKGTPTIYAGAIIGNYAGVLTTHHFADDKKQTFEYALELQLRSTTCQKLYIDSTTCGNITRMINQACDRSNMQVCGSA